MQPENKLLDFQKKVGAIAKDSLNPFFKKNYFDINGLIAEIKPILNEVGLTLTQPISFEFDVTSGTGRSILHTYLKDGNNIIESSSINLPENLDPQKMGSAITYFRRYSIQSMLLLQAEDDDANKASGHKVTETKEPERNPFIDMENAKDLETVKKLWSEFKDLQKDNLFAGLKEKKKTELTPAVELQPHPLNTEPEKFTVEDILPGEVEEVQTATFTEDAIAKLSKVKTITGLNTMFRELKNNAGYLFLDESDKNKITDFCKTIKAKLNEKK